MVRGAALRQPFARSDRDVEAYFSALESGKVRPALITLDDELKRFGPRLLNFLDAHYVSANGLFYVPAPR